MDLKKLAELENYNEIVIAAAAAAHEAIREYCVSLGDESQVPWDEAPDWQKDSTIDGVMFILDNPDTGEEPLHENWLKAKIADGWTYGEKKDPKARTHPCLVEFERLPTEQREKDRIFRVTVLAKFAEAMPVDKPVDRGQCPALAFVTKYGDRIPVQLRGWEHFDRLVAEHGDASVKLEVQ